MELDFKDATLEYFDLVDCRVAKAFFHGTTFIGSARFEGTEFLGEAMFECAVFESDAGFDGARFRRAASFISATVDGVFSLRGARAESSLSVDKEFAKSFVMEGASLAEPLS